MKGMITPIWAAAVLAMVMPPVAAAQTNVPAGTRLVIRLDSGINTKTSQTGDTFTAHVVDPPQYEGAVVRGHIARIDESGRFRGRTEMSLAFDDIRFRNGRVQPIRAELTELRESESVKVVDEEGNIRSGSRSNQTLKRSGIGAAAGGVLGGILGGGKGALVGILLGGGAGAGSLILEGPKELRLEPGTEMEIRTVRDSRVLARSDYADRATIREVQRALSAQGYNPGPEDGVMGGQTVSALRQFQRDHQLEPTGTLDSETARLLGINR